MYQTAKPLFLYCETPLHAGSGSDLGVIDLPIQRERHTSFPKIEGSSLKGAIRERFEDVYIRKGEIDPKDKKREHAKMYDAFGPDGESNSLYAGALGFTDARLLLFPVKSMKGVFAWVTCGQILKRFAQDLAACEGVGSPFSEGNAPQAGQNKALVTSNSEVVIGKNVILEEYAFEATSDNENVAELANWFTKIFKGSTWWQQKISNSLVILSDDDFKDFVNLSTEVITRTKIDNITGTVEDGALFTEEYLPAESVMYSLVLTSAVFADSKGEKKDSGMKTHEQVATFFTDTLEKEAANRLQVGANATLGKGHIRTTLLPA